MFTGIITDIGTITTVEARGDTRIVVATAFEMATVDLGASIACSGVCLTVIDKSGPGAPGWFAVDVSGESIARTAADQWTEGQRLNLERAMKLGDELGGHIVTGHVDAVGRVTLRREVAGSIHLAITCTAEIAPFIAAKGSVTVDGVSLTVNAVEDHADKSATFDLNLIPHTAEVTTLGALQQGDAVNLEIDVLARYLKRMQALQAG